MVQIDNALTIDNLKYVIAQMKGNFIAPFAFALKPGAKINGELFTGDVDIDIPVSPQRDIILLDNRSIGILYDNEENAGLVIKNDGIYFTTGTEAIPIVKITKSGNTYNVTSNINVTAGATESQKVIGFEL